MKSNPESDVDRWPGWAVPALLAGLTLVFFAGFLFSSDMIYGSDALNGIHAKFFLADYFQRFHAFPWWFSTTLSGMPTLDAFFGDFFYPLSLLQFIRDIPRALGYKYVVTVFLAGFFMWIFLRRGLQFKTGPSLFGAVTFMFNTEFLSQMFPGHDGKMFVIGWLPLSLYALKRLLDTRLPRYAALLALSIGLTLLTSHVQTAYFSLWGLGLYFLFEAVRGYRSERNGKKSALQASLALFAVLLGLGVGMVQLLPPYMFTHQYSVRGEGDKTGFEHATSWSLHPEEAAALVVPEFCGFQDKSTGESGYWGRNPFKLNNEYAGIVPLLLSVFFLVFYRRDRFILFWWGLALFALVFALGANTPFFKLFYHLVPGVKLFRAPSMIMFWFSFSLCVVSAHGLNRMFPGEGKEDSQKKTLAARRLTFALCALAALTLVVTLGQDLVLSFWRGLFYPLMSDAQASVFRKNYPHFIAGAWWALGLGGGALLAFILCLKNALRPGALLLLLCALSLADLFRVDAYFYKLVRPSEVISRNEPALLELARRNTRDKFRVFPAPGHLGQGDAQLYGLESAGGFHDNELKWYREFRGGQGSENFLYLLQRGQIQGNPFFDLLNVKYVLFRPGAQKPLTYLENPTALPRAFCVSDFEVLPESLMVERLKTPGFPYRTRLLLSEAPAGYVSGDTLPEPCGAVREMKYTGDRRSYTVGMNRPGFLVLSEIYFSYWKAHENGRNLPVLRTNLALTAIPLSAGEHTIEMTYRSPYIRTGAAVTLVSLGICLLAFIFSTFFIEKRRPPAP